ncbi:MAG: TetR/AcrR family transcriptional regulator [Bifidobacterium psychraerophilum]|uniref:TetR/AcrR family transcriptional regulator n=1 Tax=Bifidobacterium psychraerophilum TaxID=218140 RepID=UPI0039E7493E
MSLSESEVIIMPKIVDHEARRNSIVRAFLELVGEQGMAEANSRALARKLDISNSLLWRYFDDMNQLIEQAYTTITEDTSTRIQYAVEHASGLHAFNLALDEIFPISEVSRVEAKIAVSFWGLAVSTHSQASVTLDELNEWSSQLEGFLQQAVELGEISESAPLRDLAQMAISTAIQAQVEYAMTHSENRARTLRESVDAVLRLAGK